MLSHFVTHVSILVYGFFGVGSIKTTITFAYIVARQQSELSWTSLLLVLSGITHMIAIIWHVVFCPEGASPGMFTGHTVILRWQWKLQSLLSLDSKLKSLVTWRHFYCIPSIKAKFGGWPRFKGRGNIPPLDGRKSKRGKHTDGRNCRDHFCK